MVGEDQERLSVFSKRRAEALSDGVFAIAMTLLVLDLKVPADYARGQLWAVLSQESTVWYSILLTFLIAGMFWMLQHRVFDLIEGMSRPTVWLTLATLGLVTILPFSTSMLGHARGDPLAFELYFGNQAAIAFSLVLKLEVARAQGSLHAGATPTPMRRRLWSITIVMLSAVVAAPFLPAGRLWMAPVGVGWLLRGVRYWAEKRRRTVVQD